MSSICSLHTCNPQIAHWGVISLLLGLWVDLYQTQFTKGNKILPCTVCVITSKPNLCARRSGLERAALPVSARLWIWVTIFELEHMDSKVLQFTNSSRPGWSAYSGFLLQHLTEAPTAKQHQMIQSHQVTPILYEFDLWVYYSYGGPLCVVHALYNCYAHKFIPFGYHSLFGIQIFQQLNTIV